MKLLDLFHGAYVHRRRVRVLAAWFARQLPPGATVLDVGCGDGALARAIGQLRPGVTLRGVDVLVRPQAAMPVQAFDGRTLPFAEGSFDFVMFVDVLHHTEDPMILLREGRRVARRGLLLKDHTADGWQAVPTLRFMDRVGNLRHGVALPYQYWPRARWEAAWAGLGLRVAEYEGRLKLYPPPASWLFDRSLHFAARLEPA